MLTLFNKTALVLLLCLIFIAQSMASMTMFYRMASMSMPEVSAIKTMPLFKAPADKMHNIATNSDDMSACHEEVVMTIADKSPTEQDCCAQECDCLTSSCSPMPTFLTMMPSLTEVMMNSKIVTANYPVISQVPNSLYKPPILG